MSDATGSEDLDTYIMRKLYYQEEELETRASSENGANAEAAEDLPSSKCQEAAEDLSSSKRQEVAEDFSSTKCQEAAEDLSS
eukprot:CAMPEP_0172920178 /NCGR_PEP_ID=MMETSP1075-20121228/203587_1 /TAXON_ID=2916 /ORGANISM="Ceratium fusus, Strain PA161109" /LENGTH=81 /DNA_ID=CAMNT_0013780151 /DNA_START=54 /DNA_END=295 /DNA_ORIENTATION=-